MEEVKFNDNKKKKQLVIKQKSGENKNTGEFTLYEAGAHFNYKDLYFKLEKISKDKKVVGQVNQINLGNYLFHNNFETHNSKSKHKLVNLKNQRNEKNDNLKKNNTLNNKEKVNVILPLISSLANSFDSTSITVENKKKDSFKGIVEKYTITEACRPNFGRNNILNSKFNTLPVKSTRNMNTNEESLISHLPLLTEPNKSHHKSNLKYESREYTKLQKENFDREVKDFRAKYDKILKMQLK